MLQTRVALIGDAKEGKKELRRDLIEKNIPFRTRQSIGVSFGINEMKVDGMNVRFHICDVSGLPRFRALRKTYYSGCTGAIAVFDTNRPETFRSLNEWIAEFWKARGEGNVTIILAGHRERNAERSSQEVTDNQARHLAETLTKSWEEAGLRVLYYPYEETDNITPTTLLETLGRSTIEIARRNRQSVIQQYEHITGVEETTLQVIENPLEEGLEGTAIMLLVLSSSGLSLFSAPFLSEEMIDDQMLAGFLNAVDNFGRHVFSRPLNQVNLGEYTVLMKPDDQMIPCYIFKGQSHSAAQKLEEFMDTLRCTPAAWQALVRTIETGRMLNEEEHVMIEELATQVFTY